MADREYKPTNLADLFRQAQKYNVGSTGETTLGDLVSALAGTPSWPPPPPPPIRDRWFKDQNIHVDGYTFERCRFDRCNFITEAATFRFRECFISADCGLYFMGPSLKVVRLLMHTLRVKGRVQMLAGEEALYAALNLDGTFSLE